MKYPKLIVLLILFLLLSVVVSAQGTMVTIDRWKLGGGGNVASSGGKVSLHSALGHAVAGPGSGGNIYMQAGFWSGGLKRPPPDVLVYLPTVLKNFILYAPPCSAGNNYCEDYDTYDSAYGPLQPGVAYPAYPNDSTDYYYFELGVAQNVTVQVQDYQATGDLILYEHREGDTPAYKANWGKGGSTMTLTLPLQAGKYYVRVYTTGGYNQGMLYALTVSWVHFTFGEKVR